MNEEDFWLPHWPPNTQPKFIYNRPTFERHVGKSGKTWLVPAVTVLPNQADHIYVSAYSDLRKKGSGFAGATLDMPLINGKSFLLRGGWHSRAEALLEDTSIDVRNTCLTYGAVALHRSYKSGMELVGLLYVDHAPRLGYHERIIRIARGLANERRERVFYSYLSAGGGSSAIVYPRGR